jgi:hypothetical protein
MRECALFFVLVMGCTGGSGSSDGGADGAARACTMTLTGDVTTTLSCEIAAGSVGFTIEVKATASQPLHVSIQCDTPSEVKVDVFTPPSCQALINEAGTGRLWTHTPDLRVDITQVTAPKVGVIVLAGSAHGNLTSAQKDGGMAGTVTLQAMF